MKTIVISGLGLIGSSIARIMKQADPAIEIIGCDPDDDSAQFLLTQRVIDRRLTFAAAVPLADIIVLAGPVSVIIEQIRKLAVMPLKDNVLVTDVGSSKVTIMDAAQLLIDNQIAFLGGHPMAGSHESGSQSGRINLFAGATYFLVSGSQTRNQLSEFQRLMAPAKVRWTEIAANDHDQLVSELSHVPHVIATTLVNTVAKSVKNNQIGLQAAAGGFKDTTRIAASDPTMWTAILLSNGGEICKELEDFKAQLTQFEAAIRRGDRQEIFETLKKAQRIRQSLDR
ncbi:prephenate dehydrogenase [Lentilactobacillus kisonensis]|nr:prephenate dehydrogenase/arogenate dehydrogenase family protein [Lentilactobacillus kisonensis]EHO51880.1 prephenate dehydrogenase [Lentilactobacillus kisonensis F0435]